MECYQVGGAVRDRLLGQPVLEKDYVVVGSSPEALLSKGFKQVGKDFPVFLHPITHEEYALARTERKQGSGYKGFTVYAAPEVTLKEDLKRRDLTINAIAQNEQGMLIDPYGGCDDLKKRILRHVSPAFIEDPVRVLRIARFMARFAHLGFRIAPETFSLMQQMVAQGEIESLVAERVWKEFEKALHEPTPKAFITSLVECGAWDRLCPAWVALTQSQKMHALQTLEQATQLSQVKEVRFASFIKEVDAIEHVSAKWRLPTSYRELALLSARYVKTVHHVTELAEESLLDVLMQLDVLRRDVRLQHFLIVCQADWIVSHNDNNVPYQQKDYLNQAVQTIKSLDLSSLIAKRLKGVEFQVHLRQLRIEALTRWRALHHQ